MTTIRVFVVIPRQALPATLDTSSMPLALPSLLEGHWSISIDTFVIQFYIC
jgi:hypothetical protein